MDTCIVCKCIWSRQHACRLVGDRPSMFVHTGLQGMQNMQLQRIQQAQPTRWASCPGIQQAPRVRRVRAQREAAVTTVLTREPESISSPLPNVIKAPTTQPQPAPHGQTDQYSWLRNWWPVSPTDYLDKQRPTQHTILGTDLVVWWKQDAGTWQVFQDRCPHRLAPLSQGRIVENQLLCSYHGWSFGEKGECTNIPQLPSTAQQAACSQKRSCATAYPSQVVQGVLFVWMDPTPEGVELSHTKGMPLTACPTIKFGLSINENDARAGWEQSMDATHANYLHHDMGFPMQDVLPMECMERPEVDLQQGFTVTHGGYSVKNKGMVGVRHFIPPYTSIVVYKMPAGYTTAFHIMVVPMSPGRSRTLAGGGPVPKDLPMDKVVIRDSAQHQSDLQAQSPAAEATQVNWMAAASNAGSKQTASSGLIRSVKQAWNKWKASWPHWTRDMWSLGDQDVVMNASQERALIHSKLATKNYHMPAIQADVGVLAVNKWLSKAGYPQSLFGNVPHPAETEQPGHLPLDKLLDRRARHVDHCIICQQGFKLVTQACWALTVASILCGAFAITTAAVGLIAAGNVLAGGLPLGISSVLCPLLAWAAVKLWDMREDRFISGVKAWTRKGGLSLIPRT